MNQPTTAKCYVDPTALPPELSMQLRQENAPPITFRGLAFHDREGIYCAGSDAEATRRALDHQLPNCPVTQVIIQTPYGAVTARSWDEAIQQLAANTRPFPQTNKASELGHH